MLREAKHLWILRFRVGGTTCSEILGSAQNDNFHKFCAQNPDHAWNSDRIYRCRICELDFCWASALNLARSLWTIETASGRINSVVYEGSGTGGLLHIND